MAQASTSQSTFPDFTGHQIGTNGRYSLLNLLGSGSYGRVYHALDNNSPLYAPRYRAVKCLKQHHAGSRFDRYQQNEFSIQGQLTDSGVAGIVGLHEVFYESEYECALDSQDSFVYAVLDFCDGGDLFDVISHASEEGGLRGSEELLRSLYVQVVDAVHACHKVGVFHRDLKPENVLCMSDGSIRLADFGLCTRQTESTEFGCGSYFYMSPECLSKTSSSYSTLHNDIWALGVMLVTMSTGRVPWARATFTDRHYEAFLTQPQYFADVLGMSQSAAKILKRVFRLNPRSRISLPELKQEVLALDAFLREEKPELPQCLTDTVGTHAQAVFSCHDNASSSGLPSTFSNLLNSSSLLDTPSSSLDDDGPDTPETRAVCPPLEVPDFRANKNTSLPTDKPSIRLVGTAYHGAGVRGWCLDVQDLL